MSNLPGRATWRPRVLPILLLLILPAGVFQREINAAQASSGEVGTGADAIGGSATTRASPDGPGGAPAGWKTFRHPMGGFFHLPADWRIQPAQGGLLLIPADFRQGQELILVFGAPLAEAIQDPADERIGAYFDQLMTQLAPGARRVGASQRLVATTGNGALYTYQDAAPTGQQMTARIFVTLLDRTAVDVSFIATDELLALREPTVRRVFTSMAHGQKQLDQRLVGSWSGEDVRRSNDGDMHFNTRFLFAFLADGRVLHGTQSAVSAVTRDRHKDIQGTASGQTDASVQSGTWAADGKLLTIAWSNGGGGTFTYGFEPDGSLILRDPATGKLLNYYRRAPGN